MSYRDSPGPAVFLTRLNGGLIAVTGRGVLLKAFVLSLGVSEVRCKHGGVLFLRLSGVCNATFSNLSAQRNHLKQQYDSEYEYTRL